MVALRDEKFKKCPEVDEAISLRASWWAHGEHHKQWQQNICFLSTGRKHKEENMGMQSKMKINYNTREEIIEYSLYILQKIPGFFNFWPCD